jgi:hypothetical protein
LPSMNQSDTPRSIDEPEIEHPTTFCEEMICLRAISHQT